MKKLSSKILNIISKNIKLTESRHLRGSGPMLLALDYMDLCPQPS